MPDFLAHAYAITGITIENLLKLPALKRAQHALAAPNSGFEGQSYYATFSEKAAAMTYLLIKDHPLIDGNKRVSFVCLLDFVYRNGYTWIEDPEDPNQTETVEMIESVAAGNVTINELATWISQKVRVANSAD